MMDLSVIYDDRLRPTEDAQAFVGIDRYGALLFRKRLLSDHIREIFREAGAIRFAIIRDDADLALAMRTIADGPRSVQVIYFPACFATTDEHAMRRFFRKLRCSDDAFQSLPTATCTRPVLAIKAEHAPDLLLRLSGTHWRELLEEVSFTLHQVDNQAALVDLAEPGVLGAYLSSTFDVRHFNAIALHPLTVTKRSGDIGKMRREYQFFSLLPEALRLYFLPPLGWEEGADWASYRTERLYVPDLAIQWVHRAFDIPAFSICLQSLEDFIAARPVREISGERSELEHRRLYVDKVDERLRQLQALPLCSAIDKMLAACTSHRSVADLVTRYHQLYDRLRPRRHRLRQAISHGDLCFSNILYGRRQRMTKFIDPRGADGVEEIWLDEYYDLAKLSHSVLGSYDFINHDLFEFIHGQDLSLELRLEHDGQDDLRAYFRSRISAMGYDVDLMRLYEASLFLSMLPLHAEGPKKVLAFVLTAAGIMGEIEQHL